MTVQADERFGTVQTAEGTNNFQQRAVVHFVARDFGNFASGAQAVGSVPQAAEFVGKLMAAELSLLFLSGLRNDVANNLAHNIRKSSVDDSVGARRNQTLLDIRTFRAF